MNKNYDLFLCMYGLFLTALVDKFFDELVRSRDELIRSFDATPEGSLDSREKPD